MKKKQVLVACGAGIATSTIVNKEIEEICKENNIECDIVQIKITEVGSYVDTADLLISTTIVQTEYPFPVINARAFLTGIGLDEVKKEILEQLKK
ncbi:MULTISPECIES: PTS sugar transporter subunit IIB [Bacillales]|jgi:galactitol PTS system EIIB component|uniref:PTS system galactitol-specific IIB component n=1 Tax=[Anoxybacillus] calidus TaxID=575178 RepID=A0A7V9YZ08_9BACL|nr:MULTISPECIES: PTS sugar transporter subunit IIB [Bacillaceae]MBA2871069.1 PTS system galactitol-specific IIB component [Anoxybacillus calidus]